MNGTAPIDRRRARGRRFRVILWMMLATAIGLPAGGHMGLLSGTRPDGLGFAAGRFKPCSWKPNCVSSTADPKQDAGHHIAPIAFAGDAAAAWARLSALVRAMPRTSAIREDYGYLQVEVRSRLMGFTDDVEFALDASAGVIHVRSASRLGVRDFGVNRARVEAIRAAFAAA
jgi:uncharacterized protein (DUF1499 family)